MRTPIIIGNWKMNKTVSEAIRIITELKGALSGKQEVEIVIAPPFISLHPAEIAAQGTPIRVGAQNVYYEDRGAYTGEISPGMLAEAGCQYVIIGHSERRQIFGETNQMINKKVHAVMEHEMIPILCVGETKTQRQEGKTFEVLESQIQEGLRGLSDIIANRLIVAYEPVWAIGTGETASPGTAQEVHSFIRGKLGALFRKDVAQDIRVIYGGSVNSKNIKELMTQPDIDGALVGGASLVTQDFVAIVNYGD